jgi:ABC-2 type transport system permease protein
MSDLTLFRNALRDLVRPGKLAAAVILISLCVLVAVLRRANADPGAFDAAATYNGISSGLVFGFTVVILSAVFATSLIGQEIELKTIPYLLTRPMPRWRILLAKYLAAVVVTVVTVWLADLFVALALFGPAKLGASSLWRDILILPMGVMVYSGMFLLLSTLVPKPLLFGLGYGIIEPWLPNLPGDFNKISPLTYLHVLAPHLDAGDVSQTTDAVTGTAVPVWAAWIVVVAIILTTVIAALVIFSIREYVPQEDKT